MKKFILMVCALAITLGSYAQVRTSRTFTKSKSRTEWILRAGLNVNNLSGLEESRYEEKPDVSSNLGFDVDFGFNKYFGQSNVYWGMELGIGTRGVKFDSSDEEVDDLKVSLYNVKLSPFTVGYKIPVVDMLKVDPHLGAYVSYDFANSGTNDFELDGSNSVDAGLQIGVGLWYNKFNIDFMYQIGFVNLDPEFSCYGSPDIYLDGGKTRNFLIRLGVSF